MRKITVTAVICLAAVAVIGMLLFFNNRNAVSQAASGGIDATGTVASGDAAGGTAMADDASSIESSEPVEKGSWRITQYCGQSGMQSMFYTIEDADSNLVIVDGGWDVPTDIALVKGVIEAHGNHVNTWIVTHAHPDHVGVFNAIAGDADSGITIDRIYTPHVDKQRYEETALDYDGIESYYEFLEVIEGMDNITEVSENDEIDLLGLRMKIVHAWDDNVAAMEKDVMNYGSLMFTVSGAEESMLFCSDVQKEMEVFIEETQMDALQNKYVQCGHHGNNGLSHEFYDIVDSEYAFIDAPEPIRIDETGKYDCKALMDHLTTNGVQLFTWENPTNVITIH